jgi:DNA-binding XRE family transcriptional regulator
MTFPEQLKTHRERLSLTQAELAAFLEVSPRAVWQWEKGELPHILTQEGALARLEKAKKRPKE